MLRNLKRYYFATGFSGLLAGALSSVTGKAKVLKVSRPALKHPVYFRVPSSDIPAFIQVFRDEEYAFTTDKPPAVIVDAGANVGFAAVYFANKYPDAKIIAIEPEAGNFEMLKKNTQHYPNITAVQAALWHQNGEINLMDPGLGNWGFMTATQDVANQDVAAHLPGDVRHTVPSFTVDQIMADHGLAQVDILKIDIEGAEKEVFSDSSAWLDRVDAIIAELHERMKPGCNRSFYVGSQGFDHEWEQGENVYLSRNRFPMRQRVTGSR